MHRAANIPYFAAVILTLIHYKHYMNIEKNAFVSLVYELRTENSNGPLVEKTTTDRPLRFVFGSGRMLEKFEQNIAGLTVGSKFDFTLASADAYGEINKEAIVDIPKNVFVVNGQLREDLLVLGGRVPMMGAGGQRMDGIVLEVTDDTVKMDFNHPLAGEDLHFSGEVIEVREATAEELIGGEHHGCGGGCGGGCEGGCGGGCHGDCDGDDDEECDGGCGGCGCH